ncbi:chloride channel [Chytriomyces cf. hyalinus JEL632]|nr:chloride channel [Chytriomyces cf. hyalinus JEL632]
MRNDEGGQAPAQRRHTRTMSGSVQGAVNGLRAWYDDMSTIDWLQDTLVERGRVRAMRLSAQSQQLDSVQAWLLVIAVAVSTASVAAAVDVAQTSMASLRSGYCSTAVLKTRDACCRGVGRSEGVFSSLSLSSGPSNSSMSNCKNWISWDIEFGNQIDFAIYVSTALVFALIAVLITNMSVAVVQLAGGATRKTYQASGSGIAEVKTILGGFVIRGYLGFQTGIAKAVGLIFALASGISIGQQGPFVHIACAIGNIYSRFFPKYATNEGKKREILSAASAAGVSVAFAAPIGGVLWSFEEASYYFPMKTMWRSFLCSCVAAVTLKILNPFGSGRLVKFQVAYERDWRDFELIPFAILGVMGGLYGALYIRFTSAVEKFRASKFNPIHPVIDVCLVAVVSAIANYQSEWSRMGLNDLVAVMFSECRDETDLYGICNLTDFRGLLVALMNLLLVKFVLIVWAFGIRVPGGVVTPSMVMGATMGRVVGILVLKFQQAVLHPECIENNECVTPGVYAMVGAAATLSGVTRMTVSLVVIMMELTGALKLVLPLMVSIMIAKWTADSFSRDSVFDAIIRRRGFPYLDHKREHHPPRGKVPDLGLAGDVAEYDHDECFQMNTLYSFHDLNAKLSLANRMDDCGYAILEGRTLAGYISYQDLQRVTCRIVEQGQDEKPCVFRTPKNHEMRVSMAYFKNSNTLVVPSDLTPLLARNRDSETGSFDPTVSEDEIDLTPWTDQAPLVLAACASMDLCLEVFMKLGCKTVCVVDFPAGGSFVGLIHKKRVLAWLNE